MRHLNYNHLRYFWMVAHQGNLTRAAERMHVSQSALSLQIRKLEEAQQQFFRASAAHYVENWKRYQRDLKPSRHA